MEEVKVFMQELVNEVAKGTGKEVMQDAVAQLHQKYAELQKRRACVRVVLNTLHHDIDYCKSKMGILYDKAVPGTFEGQMYFDSFSRTRTDVRKLRQMLKSMVQVQLDIKEQMQQTSDLIRMIGQQLRG